MAFQGEPFEQLGAPWDRGAAFIPPPIELLDLPAGMYGIAYDMDLHRMQDPPPDGWAQWSATVCRRIKVALTAHNFQREQYSLWHVEATGFQTFISMLNLRSILPRGIFATCIRRLEMFQIMPPPDVFINTARIQLGGLYSPFLLGPTPAGLSLGMGVPPPQNWPNNPGDVLPAGVKPMPGSWDNENWRV